MAKTLLLLLLYEQHTLCMFLLRRKYDNFFFFRISIGVVFLLFFFNAYANIRNIAGHLQKNALEMVIVFHCLNEMGIEPKADKCYRKTIAYTGPRKEG